jgi:hypothetical protein
MVRAVLAMAVCAEAETRWHSPIGDNAREELEDTVVFMLAAFGAGLRGEEVPLISLDGLLTFWDESRLDKDSHVMLTLYNVHSIGIPAEFRRNAAKGRPFRNVTGTGTGMCYNTILDIPVYSGWYLSTRFLQVENACNYSK